jgi:hypothetical protein
MTSRFLTTDRTIASRAPQSGISYASHTNFKTNGIHVDYRQTIPRLTITQRYDHDVNREPLDCLMRCVFVKSMLCPDRLFSFSSACYCAVQFHVVFGRLLCVYTLLNKVGSRCTTQGIPDLVQRQLTTLSSGWNPVVSRGASVKVSPARHVDDVTTNITADTAASSHYGFSHKRTATRVMAS